LVVLQGHFTGLYARIKRLAELAGSDSNVHDNPLSLKKRANITQNQQKNSLCKAISAQFLHLITIGRKTGRPHRSGLYLFLRFLSK